MKSTEISLLVIILTTASIVSLNHQQQSALAAPLTSRAVIPSNNIVSTTSTYEIIFNTASIGSIKTIQLRFTSGYNVAGATIIEKAGIGSGVLSVVGNTVIFTVTTPVSVAASTPIRLELANIVSEISPSAAVTIRTKDIIGNVIDGPTAVGVPLKQITTTDIHDSSVTGSKIAGIDRLIFVSCTLDFPSLEPDELAVEFCDVPGAVGGDSVVAGHHGQPMELLIHAETVVSLPGDVSPTLVVLVKNLESHTIDPDPEPWDFIIFHTIDPDPEPWDFIIFQNR
jgi:hypothetical protein